MLRPALNLYRYSSFVKNAIIELANIYSFEHISLIIEPLL